jgi:hypothetical protein
VTIEELLHEKRLLEAGFRASLEMFSEKTKLPVVGVHVEPVVTMNGEIKNYHVDLDVRLP